MDIFTKVEFHCHTANSFDCDIPLLKRIEKYRDNGFTHLAITDHDVVLSKVDRALINSENTLIKIIPGIEVSTHIGHIILLGCNHRPLINSLFYLVFLSKVFDYKIYVPHPCRKGTGLLYEYVVNKIPTWYIAWFFQYVSYVEVWNPRDTLKDPLEVDLSIWKSLESLMWTVASDSHFDDDTYNGGCPMIGLARDDEYVKRFFSQKIKLSEVKISLTLRAFLRYIKSALRYIYRRYA